MSLPTKRPDTRSDIYSLGVLLYELLTGRPPFETKVLLQCGVEGMRRTLRDQEPQRPSAMVAAMQSVALTEMAHSRQAELMKLISLLRGDLDWIVLRTLEKDRKRRYETANGLAVDIQRFLDNEPVSARPPSRLYRLQKLARRNKATFAAGAVVAMALIGGLGLSTWFWHQERTARKRAVLAEQQALAAEQQQARLRMEAEDRERITQAAFLISQGKIEAADQMVDKVLEVKPSLEAQSVLRTLGEWHALKGDWAQATQCFTLLLEADQKGNSWAITEDLLKAGPILIEHGSLQNYERFRLVAIARFADATEPTIAERTLKICLLTPADEPLLKLLEPLSEAAANSMKNPGRDPGMEAWRCVSLALMAYRENYTPTAKAWCRRCLSYAEQNPARMSTAHIIQAMSCNQLGETDEARLELAKGRKMVEAQFSKKLQVGGGINGFWFDWFFARILLREAEALIESPPPGK